MPDEPVTQQPQRPILHLPKAKLNGAGVVMRPSGEVRMQDVIEEHKNPEPPEQGG